ncbi:ATP-binding protein [Acidaminobacter sp.]|uniref:ATP-binding protein n=1 Tax=Acidaminobacter sp. TaxID=1872102 RepID=UPI002562E54B|nr:ATP-binding protein [Acidaminobacter sp.]MDK9711512.1 ATP-binding protein [Acidaminobacter sp.]
MFIGRTNELTKLEKLYKTNKFEFMIMFGRRRIGKTRLLTEFIKNKEAIFFSAEENNDKLNLSKFTDAIREHYPQFKYIPDFDKWDHAFKFIAEIASDQRIVVVIDELPYIAQSNPSFLSTLQHVIDHTLSKTNLFLIACGSSISFIENEVISEKSPLFGRKTAQMHVQPLDYFDAAKFFPNYTYEDKVKTYCLLGGIPQYLNKFDASLSLPENIIEHILDTSAYLYDEPKNLMHQELRVPAVYNAIIEAISSGATKLNEISTKSGEDSRKLSKYILHLVDLHILKKEFPITNEKFKNTIYRVNDLLFKFIYRFVYPNKSLIERDKSRYVYEEKILPELSTFLGSAFETVCMEYLLRMDHQSKLPFTIENIGRWWGNNPIKQKQDEIDLIALGRDAVIFGECKFKNDLMDVKALNLLVERSLMFAHENKYYYLFSKSGFTKQLIEKSKEQSNIRLIQLDNLFLDVVES